MNVEIKGGKTATQRVSKQKLCNGYVKKERQAEEEPRWPHEKNQKKYFTPIKVTINRDNLDETSNMTSKKNVIQIQGEMDKSANILRLQCTFLANSSKYLRILKIRLI